MDCGYASADGIRRCNASSIRLQPASSVSLSDSFCIAGLFLSAGLGSVGIEWLRRDLVALFKQDLDLAFGSFQLPTAIIGQLHTFFEQSESLLQRDFTLFQLVNYLLKPLQAFLKLWHAEIVSVVYLPALPNKWPIFSCLVFRYFSV